MTPDRSTTYEISLLALIALGVIILLGIGLFNATKSNAIFDPSAYLVVLTLIVGAIKERWLSRSVDKMGQKLADSAPHDPNLLAPAEVVVVNEPSEPVPTTTGGRTP